MVEKMTKGSEYTTVMLPMHAVLVTSQAMCDIGDLHELFKHRRSVLFGGNNIALQAQGS